MEIKTNNLFKRIFAIAFFFAIISILMRINHLDNDSLFLSIGVVSTLVYIVIGIFEVYKSNRIGNTEKALWTVGFIVLSFFVGIYYFMNRERIIRKYN